MLPPICPVATHYQLETVMNHARTSARAQAAHGRPASIVVAETLARHPDRTAAELAQLAGLGASTVAKALATLEKAGSARRHVPDLGGSHTDSLGSAHAGSESGKRRPAAHWRAIAAEPEPSASGRGTAPRTRSVPARTAPNTPTASRRNRLGKGELTTLVLEYLVSHSDADLGPTVISRALQRSQGAVANCLTKLTADGDLVQTCEHPRRYRVTS